MWMKDKTKKGGVRIKMIMCYGKSIKTATRQVRRWRSSFVLNEMNDKTNRIKWHCRWRICMIIDVWKWIHQRTQQNVDHTWLFCTTCRLEKTKKQVCVWRKRKKEMMRRRSRWHKKEDVKVIYKKNANNRNGYDWVVAISYVWNWRFFRWSRTWLDQYGLK